MNQNIFFSPMLPNLVQVLLWVIKETAAFQIVQQILNASRKEKNLLNKTITTTRSSWNHAIKTMMATVIQEDSAMKKKIGGETKLEEF